MPYRVSKTIPFCYGHRLLHYAGKCKNLHGHNGSFQVVLEARRLDNRGMVSDFSEIKRKIKAWIDDHWDHRMILNVKDPWLKSLQKIDPTVVAVNCNPTAENLARLFFQKAKTLGFPVVKVKLWETESSWASYRE